MTKQAPRIVSNPYGVKIDFKTAVSLMDDDIRETIHIEHAPCGDQEFFDAYCAEHEEKFGKEFEPAKRNPPALSAEQWADLSQNL